MTTIDARTRTGVGRVRSTGVVSQFPVGGVMGGDSPQVVLPRGFDAIAQCDHRLLHVQLGRSLFEAGLSTLGTRVAYTPDGLPAEVLDAIAPHITLHDVVGVAEIAVELRLLDARLHTLGYVGSIEPPVGVVLPSAFDVDETPAEIAWTLELNLLRIVPDRVLTQDVDVPVPSPSRGTRVPLGGVLAPPDRPPAPASDTGVTRMRLAAGRASTRMPTRLVTRPELLQAWLEFDTAHTATVASADDPPLDALLQTQRGEDLLRSALAAFISAPGLQASPRIVVGGSLAPQHVASLGLGAMRVRHLVHRRPDGGEVLSLAFTFGDDAGGAMSELQPFIGPRHFGYYMNRATFAPVLSTRWTLRPAAHEFVGDVPLEMPQHEGSDDFGEGLVRLRVRLGAELTDVGLMAVGSADGDILRLACDQEVQLLAAWYADGNPVDDLGELGEPATMPFVVNVAPFTPVPAGDAGDTPFREFLLTVLEPMALPMIDRFAIHRVEGFLSEALAASVAWWSMPTPVQETTGDLLDTAALGR